MMFLLKMGYSIAMLVYQRVIEPEKNEPGSSRDSELFLGKKKNFKLSGAPAVNFQLRIAFQVLKKPFRIQIAYCL